MAVSYGIKGCGKMQKCYDCGRIYFGSARHCPKCSADQWEGKFGVCSRYSLQNTLKNMDINDCDFEEYIFIGEMIVRKMQEEESYNEFGWRPVAALIDAYTRDTPFKDFKRALELCPLYGKCMHADFGDDAKIIAEQKAEEVYAKPGCPFKPEPKTNPIVTLLTRLLKDLEEMPKTEEYDFVGRQISRKDLAKMLSKLNKFANGDEDMPSAPKFIYFIGLAYEQGRPFPQNTQYAKAWYKAAADLGDEEAKAKFAK